MLILETGKDGIFRMSNSHTKDERDKIAVHKGMDLTGPVSVTGSEVELGYNEKIVCNTVADANRIFMKIAKEL